MKKLQQKLNYNFKDISLLQQALTHKSANKKNNERLEFLGDSVLGMVIAKYIYNKFANINEGQLTIIRSNLVCGRTLCAIAYDLNLSDVLILGKGELKTGGASRCSILEDALEAIFGAILLDSNFADVQKVILAVYKQRLQNISTKVIRDHKSMLQEYLQKYQLPLPNYSLISSIGDDHNAMHTVLCQLLEPKISVEKTSSSVKYAEQDCAQVLLQNLLKNDKKK